MCKAHSGILGKGLALSHSPTILEALEGNLPLHIQTNEHSFLEDFITCVQNSSGGRLARYASILGWESKIQIEWKLPQKKIIHIEFQFFEINNTWAVTTYSFPLCLTNADGYSQTLTQILRRHPWFWTKMIYAVGGQPLWWFRPKTSMGMWCMFLTWRSGKLS